MNCELGKHIVPAGWHNWNNKENEKTARYAEYGNTGEGAITGQRVGWAKQLTEKEVNDITLDRFYFMSGNWNPCE